MGNLAYISQNTVPPFSTIRQVQPEGEGALIKDNKQFSRLPLLGNSKIPFYLNNVCMCVSGRQPGCVCLHTISERPVGMSIASHFPVPLFNRGRKGGKGTNKLFNRRPKTTNTVCMCLLVVKQAINVYHGVWVRNVSPRTGSVGNV